MLLLDILFLMIRMSIVVGNIKLEFTFFICIMYVDAVHSFGMKLVLIVHD